MAQIALRPAETVLKAEGIDFFRRDIPGIGVAKQSSSAMPKKDRTDDSDASSLDEGETRPVRKKRPNLRYADQSSDDEYCLRALKRTVPRYKELDSSSESESDFTRPLRDTALKPTGLPIGVVRGCVKCSDCQAVLARWRPENGCKPCVEEAPVFHPTEEEFKDTLAYIAKIRPAAEPYGICRVVPPPRWKPPCPLKEDEAKLHYSEFPTRVQEIHKLQVRKSVSKCQQLKPRGGGRRGRGGRGRMGRPGRRTPNLSNAGNGSKCLQPDECFGFEPGASFSLSSFEKYADEFKEQYFQGPADGSKCGYPEDENANKVNPSVDEIEGEYWRIVEHPTERIEVLYGADVETGRFGSGFPKSKPGEATTDSSSYETSGWNLNNIARLGGSVLAYENSEISGVLVPWLYVGMCFSSFCWHVEDHHFYSLNYMHWGSPKVWYGVPGQSASDLEKVMQKHLPDLFEEQPDLLHKLVTQLSPSILKAEGVPVYRLVQQTGEFVITFPRAYHSGFNCGFNCAEAVNVAPVDWLPHGQSAVELYKEQHRKTSVSHDKLLLAAARHAAKRLWQIRKMNECNGRQDLAAQGPSRDDKFWQEICGQGGVLVLALKERVQMERTRQAAFLGEVHMKKMDRIYDSTDERECAECHYDLHLSAIGCECSPEKYVCLPHAKLLCGCPWGRKSVLYRYDILQLELLVAALEDKAGALGVWMQQEQCLTSFQSYYPHSGTGEAVWKGSVQTEYAAKGLSFAKGTLRVPDSDFGVEYKRESFSSFSVSSLDVNGNAAAQQLFQGTNSEGITQNQQYACPVNNYAQVQSASVLGDSRVNVGGVLRQWGPTSEGRAPGNFAVKTEPQIFEIRGSSSRSAVTLLSDEEDAERLGESSQARETVNTRTPLSSAVNSASANLSVEACDLKASGNPIFAHTQAFASLQFGTGCSQPCTNVSSAYQTSASKVDKLQLSLAHGVTLPSPSQSPVKKRPTKLKQQARENPREGCRLLDRPVEHQDALQHVPEDVHRLRLQNGQAASSQTFQIKQDILSTARSNPYVAVQPRDTGSSKPSQVGIAGKACQLSTTDNEVPLPSQAGTSIQSRTPTRLERPAGPRVAKVVRKKIHYEVELLNVGAVVLRDGWHSKQAIYPAGFMSRTSYCNVLNITESCFYTSEVLDCGQGGPRFKVTVEGNSTATFIDDSVDACWQTVQEQINKEIIRCRSQGHTNLPALQAPQSLHGLDMFGFTSPTIIRAVEALDCHRQCKEYWSVRTRNVSAAGNQFMTSELQEHRPATPDDIKVSRPKTDGSSVEVGIRAPIPMLGLEYPSNGKVDLYSVLKSFFGKGSREEIWALRRIFSSEWQGKEWMEGFQALTDVLDFQKL
ncbi:hypothetical protein R1flu_000102 [Riccia fluitans]|uniref:Lysine-specific demethylase JMJ16 n=1 Tax=Riccia fluitans TaxID=41844 RepID=A0ABD1Y2H1_9MARC